MDYSEGGIGFEAWDRIRDCQDIDGNWVWVRKFTIDGPFFECDGNGNRIDNTPMRAK